MNKLDGKVALVTGSDRGIGQAIGLKLAGEGARLVVNDLDEGPARETVPGIEVVGARAVSVVGDVTAPDFGDRFVAAGVDAFGVPDIIVNNAGYPRDAVIQKMTDEQWYAMIDAHATAPFRVLRAAAEVIRPAAKPEAEAGEPVMREVVNVSSIAGLYGNAGQIAYAAGKSSLVGMTRTLTKEWGHYNVCVNCVAFGCIQTHITQPIGCGEEVAMIGEREIRMGVQAEALDTMVRMIPVGRGGSPEDAGGAAYLMCAPETEHISGEIVLASGGFVM